MSKDEELARILEELGPLYYNIGDNLAGLKGLKVKTARSVLNTLKHMAGRPHLNDTVSFMCIHLARGIMDGRITREQLEQVAPILESFSRRTQQPHHLYHVIQAAVHSGVPEGSGLPEATRAISEELKKSGGMFSKRSFAMGNLSSIFRQGFDSKMLTMSDIPKIGKAHRKLMRAARKAPAPGVNDMYHTTLSTLNYNLNQGMTFRDFLAAAPTLHRIMRKGHPPSPVLDPLCKDFKDVKGKDRKIGMLAPHLGEMLLQGHDAAQVKSFSHMMSTGIKNGLIPEQEISVVAEGLRREVGKAAQTLGDRDQFGKYDALSPQLFKSVDSKVIPATHLVRFAGEMRKAIEAAKAAGFDSMFDCHMVDPDESRDYTIEPEALMRLPSILAGAAKVKVQPTYAAKQFYDACKGQHVTPGHMEAFRDLILAAAPGDVNVLEHIPQATQAGVPLLDVFRHQKTFLDKGHFPTAEMVVRYHEKFGKKRRKKR